MSSIHVNQIKRYLETTFEGKIDVSDVESAPDEQKKVVFLTRALAAFIPLTIGGMSAEAAAQCVVDGANDNGIDAVFFDKTEKHFYLIQSKWKSDGHGSIEVGDTHNFIAGFKDFLDANFDRFNQKIQAKRADIEAAIYDANTKFIMVLITTGQEDISDHVQTRFADLLREMNDPVEVISLRHFKQGEIHKIISQGAQGAPINVDAMLFEWAQVGEPYLSYYGQIAASDLADLHAKHYPRILSPNLRVFLGPTTDVNEAIISTIRDNPENIWYFNNGITALCQSIRKKPVGGAGRDMGIFECEGLAIVNGAQTIGSIADAAKRYPEAVARARVPIRLISLQNCPNDFGVLITRATNTQNRIEKRDFVSLDDQQHRIQAELAFEKVTYVFKSGDALPTLESGFDLTEATVAQACSHADVAMAVLAKREISRLWEDIAKPPYKSLFNPSTLGRTLWRKVQILRIIDAVLKDLHTGNSGRKSMVPVHGNRLVAFEVFQRLDLASISGDSPLQILLDDAERLTVEMTSAVTAAADEHFPDAYLASLFKNAAKCKDISQSLRNNVAG